MSGSPKLPGVPGLPDVRFVDHLEPGHIDDLTALFESAWWTGDRPRQGVAEAVAGSTAVVAAIASDNRLIGFARALSDGIYRAMIYDVIVAESHQGSDLGRHIVASLMEQPVVRHCSAVGLMCHESMEPYYERLGFKTSSPDLRFMAKPPIRPREER